MKIKYLLLLVTLLTLGGSLFGQTLTPAGSSTGSITTNAANCNTTNACIILHMATSNVGYSVTVSGTWTGTLTVEQSGDNQGSWTSATTTTANTLFTSALTPGITDARVRSSAAMTGTAVITITASGPATLQQITQTSSSSSSPSSAAPVMGTYLSNVCGVANTGQCFFSQVDTQVANDCNWNASVVDLFCTAAHFVSADCVGGSGCTGTGTSKSLMGAQSFAGDNQGLGAVGQIHLTANVTIASFVSSTHITLSVVPANAVATNGSIAWGHLDDSGATAMDAAAQAAASCPIEMLAGGYYYFTKPHFNYVNDATVGGKGCGALPTAASYTGSNLGTVSFPAGFALEGRYGTAPTTIFLDTSFPNGDACNHVPGSGAAACFAIPVMGKWSNILMTGGNQPTAPNLNGKTLLSMQVGTLENFTGMNLAWNNATTTGIFLATLSQLNTVNNAGFGGTAIAVQGGSAYSRAVGLIVENSMSAALTLGASSAAGVPSLTCYWCIFDMPQGASNKPVITNVGGNLIMFGGTVQPANTPTTTNTGMTAYKCTGTGGTFIADGVNFNFTIGGSSDNGIWLNAQNCTASITNSYISSNQATSAVINDNGSTSGTRIFSLGGNTWIGPVNPPSAGINLNFSPSDNLTGLTGLTITCSANCGTSPSVIGRNESMVVTLGSATPAASTFTLTFIGNWPAAPSCQATRATTGTTPVPTGVVTTTTTAVVNLSANMVASEKYSVTCGPGAL